ncbi:MAG: ATP-binding protein [Acidobacteria bacterium]|nr:ATP-binding protein [Acidobacteriota bacterium]MCI0720289.1 ATP-binding protein [Acidobacteriota bacterium]
MKKTPLETQDGKSTASLGKTLRAAQQLVIYRSVLSDPVVSALLELLDLLCRNAKLTRKGLLRIAESYATFFSRLAERTETSCQGWLGTPWQNHLLTLIFNDENVFSSKAQHCRSTDFGKSLLGQVELDLCRLQRLYHADAGTVLSLLQKCDPEAEWLGWDELGGAESSSHSGLARQQTAQLFHEAAEWSLLLPALAGCYLQAGAGLFAQYRAFHWKPAAVGGGVRPIREPDPIRLEELVGYESQKEWLVRNTEHFLAGRPANNVFVYGDRGTGKSSAIKALLNHFPSQPLRMIEVSRDDLGDLPEVMMLVRPRRERFILFVDDLSFEEGETQYKTLKAVLEGSLEARPKNVLIYASSNRRHLIKEYFSDRNDLRSDEVRQQDTLQEKVSLADRFGIQLVFVTPSQQEYLAIVRFMTHRRQLPIGEEELRRRALQWVQLHNARSGRTARQFVDDLTAELHASASPPSTA